MNENTRNLDYLDIVDKWNLEEAELIDEKKSIIKNWEISLDTSTFTTLLKICEELIYYSPKSVQDKFTANFTSLKTQADVNLIFFGDKDKLLEKLKNFKEERTRFLPLRKEEREETSATFFLNFRKSTQININLTSLDRPEFILERKLNFQRKFIELKKAYINSNDNEVEINKKEFADFTYANLDMYHFENMFFIDDFIGSGSSVKEFLTNLGEFYYLFEDLTFYFFVLEVGESAIKLLNDFAYEKGISFIIIYSRISGDVLQRLFKEELQNAQKVLDKFNENHGIRVGEYCINNLSVTYANSPNNNVPFIYYSTEKWIPVFPRAPKRNLPKIKKSELIEELTNLKVQKSRNSR